MYAKVFRQIFDSSINDDYRVRFVFEDLLKLCDINGVVDMTHEAVSRVTNVPIEMVREGITKLESPDPKSRSREFEGRRIMRLDEHRDWGWYIVNYEYYRKMASEEERREKTLERVRKFRANGSKRASVTQCNAPVTQGNACNDMEREREREKKKERKGKNPPADADPMELPTPESSKEMPVKKNTVEHVNFMKGWCDRIPDYHPDGADGKQLKDLLAREGKTASELLSMVERAWVLPDNWLAHKCGTIKGFCTQFNEVKNQLKGGAGPAKMTPVERTAAINRTYEMRKQLSVLSSTDKEAYKKMLNELSRLETFISEDGAK
jgi:hypothetical protein